MTAHKPEIVITYCTQCQRLLRAAWLAQELLSTFGDDLGKVSLVPGTGGVFHIFCDDVQLWERKADGGFPEGRSGKCKMAAYVADGAAAENVVGTGGFLGH